MLLRYNMIKQGRPMMKLLLVGEEVVDSRKYPNKYFLISHM